MVRPRKLKTINFEPDVTYFKPRAIPLAQLQEVEITFDELETLRLSNLENMNQSEAASNMNVHQSTFQRTLTRGRRKVTDALVNGKAIKIYGGEYTMPRGDGTGPAGSGFGRGFSEGICKCPKCGYEQKHIRGLPCNQTKCPKCSSLMVRA